jgi:hypothetical protein
MSKYEINREEKTRFAGDKTRTGITNACVRGKEEIPVSSSSLQPATRRPATAAVVDTCVCLIVVQKLALVQHGHALTRTSSWLFRFCNGFWGEESCDASYNAWRRWGCVREGGERAACVNIEHAH